MHYREIITLYTKQTSNYFCMLIYAVDVGIDIVKVIYVGILYTYIYTYGELMGTSTNLQSERLLIAVIKG